MAVRLSDYRHSLTEEISPTQFVGGIFPRGHLSVLASRPGTGKTWFLIKTALDGSIGGSVFLGMATHSPAFKTLYFAGETGLDMLIERANLLHQPYDESKIAIYAQSELSLNDAELCLDSKDGKGNVSKIVHGEKPDLVVFDTFVSFRAGDENDARDTARVLSFLIGVARANNCAIIIAHHLRKRKRKDYDETTQDDVIGSSAMTRLCGTAFILEREGENAFVALKCVKSWWRVPETIYWRLNQNGNALSFSRPDLGENLTQARLACERYLQEMPPEELITARGLQEATASSEQGVDLAITRMLEKRVISTDLQREFYFKNVKRMLPKIEKMS